MAEAAATETANTQGTPPAAPVDTTDWKAEAERLRQEVADREQAVQYWHHQAKSATKQPAATPAAKPDQEDEDILELITSKGAKGLEEFFSKRGYVKADDVQRTVEARAQALVREQSILGQYPELKDQNSEFFKTTARHYQALKGRVPDSEAMELAAEKAELELIRSGKRHIPNSEAERQARIAAQAPEGGKGSKHEEEEGDELTPEMRQIINAFDISDDQYKKRAKAGVNILRRN